MKRLLVLALLVGVTAPLSGCTFLYVPPVPKRTDIQVTPRLILDGASELRWTGERLELSVTPTVLPEEGWLAVQWFSPQNRQVASDSVWLSGDAPLGQIFLLPAGREGRARRMARDPVVRKHAREAVYRDRSRVSRVLSRQSSGRSF